MYKKVLIAIAALLVIVGGVYFLGCPEASDQPRAIDPANVVKTRVNMTGMTCGHCEVAIEKVGANKGVAKIKAISEEQRVDVEYDKTQTDIKTIMKAIELKGFTPVSYEDDKGLHDLNVSQAKTDEPEMKCGSGKCGGAGKCGGSK